MLQTIFLWTLIARQISQVLDTESGFSHKQASSLIIKPPESNKSENTTQSPHKSVELSAEQKNMIKEVFNLFDTSSEGPDEADSGREDESYSRSGLDESEFASAIKTLGFSSRNHKKLARDLMRKVDTDGNNSISLEEFSSLMEGQLVGRDPDEEINAIFAAFVDYADNGCITKDRLAGVAEYIGVKLTDEELNSMFENAHTNSVGGIEKEEFVQILKHSTWI
jgi:Ca2+-binding EF-hand superfamily protein